MCFKDVINYRLYKDFLACYNYIVNNLFDFIDNNLESKHVFYQQIILDNMIDININIRKYDRHLIIPITYCHLNLVKNFLDIVIEFENNSSKKDLKNKLKRCLKRELYYREIKDKKELKKYNKEDRNIIERIRYLANCMLSYGEINTSVACNMDLAKYQHLNFEDLLQKEIDKNFYGNDKDKTINNKFIGAKIKELEKEVYDTILMAAFNKYPLFKKRFEERHKDYNELV